MKTILVAMTMLVAWADPVTFQGRSYRLGSFNQKANAMWEFVSAPETVNNWTTLLTIVDRSDARTVADMNRLAQGVLDTDMDRGAKVLLARTMKDAAGVLEGADCGGDTVFRCRGRWTNRGCWRRIGRVGFWRRCRGRRWRGRDWGRR